MHVEYSADTGTVRVEFGGTPVETRELQENLYDPHGIPVCVLDTKYKKPPKPATSDIAQVVAYAEAVGCRAAVLRYPSPLDVPLRGSVGDIRVKSLVFDLKQNLEAAGLRLLDELGQALGVQRVQEAGVAVPFASATA